MSDTQTKLGKIILNDDALRDAIHIAVAPVVAATMLSAGARIGFDKDGKVARVVDEIIGIVDPFLTETLYPGDRFWMFLLPNTITDLKHVWTHPAFGEPSLSQKQVAEAWLREFAAQQFTEYDYLIECAKNRDEICFGNEQDDLNSDEGIRRKFWDCLELVTGQKMTAGQRETKYFRCAC